MTRQIATFSLLFSFLSSTIWFSCKTAPSAKNFADAPKIISMKTGPCYGRCPVFELTVFQNGWVGYRGIRFTKRPGFWVNKIPKGQFEELKEEIKKTNLWQFQSIYRSQIPDVQSVTLMIYDEEGNQSKAITGKDERPQPILNIESALRKLIDLPDWIQKEKPTYHLPPGVVANQFIIQFARKVDAYKWVKKYEKHKMELVRSLSPNGYSWLVKYDDDQINPNEFLEELRLDPNVINAEFNRNLEERN